MNKLRNPSILLYSLLLMLAACATTPRFDASNIDLSISPQQASTDSKVSQGTEILWGGVILDSSNMEDKSQLEILAYPLDSSQKPDIEKNPQGRFLAIQQGYLETTDYAQGRLITLRGTLQEQRSGKIGESVYIYPVITIDQMHLWKRTRGDSRTRFHIGIGVMFHD